MRRKLVLLALSTSIALLAGWIVVDDAVEHALKGRGAGCGAASECWKEAWFRAGGRLAGGHVHDPLLGWRPAPGQVPADGHYSRVTTNRQGLRALRDATTESRGERRVAAIGDSFTFGSCVHDEETFMARLDADDGLEGLNFGVVGYGFDQSLLRLRRDVAPYAPDVVVVGYVIADKLRTVLDFYAYAKPRFPLFDPLSAWPETAPVPGPVELRTAHAARSRFIRSLGVALDLARHAKASGEEDEVSAALVGATISTIDGWHAKPVLLFIPTSEDGLKNGPDSTFVESCSTWSDRVPSLTCIDPSVAILDYLAAHPGDDAFKCHLSPGLHEVIARELRPVVSEEGAGDEKAE